MAAVPGPRIKADRSIELAGPPGAEFRFGIYDPKLLAGQLPLLIIRSQVSEVLSVRGPLDLALRRLIVGEPGQSTRANIHQVDFRQIDAVPGILAPGNNGNLFAIR